jgi:antitoxin component YwqK of YwqJK toxin-antitoxin module
VKSQLLVYIFFIYLLCFGLNSKAQSFISYKVYSNDTINVIDKDSLKQGIWKEFWGNGDLKSEVSYKNNKKQGLEIVWFDEPDCVELEAYYKDGLLDGPSIYYSKKCKKDFYENFKNGLKDGLELAYYPNGRIKAEGNFKKGNLDGYYRIYDKNGNFSFESRSTDNETNFNPNVTDTASNVVYNVLKRNKQWKNKLIVADLTGSMYSYAQQTSTWLKLHFIRDTTSQNFVFFNDGDKKRDEDKKIGATGGVYYCKAKNVDELISTMELTVKKGQGGDAPENPIEAIIYGLNKSGKAEDIILIADNWAKVRDIKMLARIKVPVRVILCGVYEGMEINEDYLNIAYKTKGSVHTIEQDITDLMKQSTGKKFNINGVDYIIKNGNVKVF